MRALAALGLASTIAVAPMVPAHAAAGLPKGRYPCYGLINGTLNYMFFDFVYRGGKSYGTVQAKKRKPEMGKMKIAADGSIKFKTGPLEEYYGGLLKPGPGIGLSSMPGGFYNTSCKPKSK